MIEIPGGFLSADYRLKIYSPSLAMVTSPYEQIISEQSVEDRQTENPTADNCFIAPL